MRGRFVKLFKRKANLHHYTKYMEYEDVRGSFIVGEYGWFDCWIWRDWKDGDVSEPVYIKFLMYKVLFIWSIQFHLWNPAASVLKSGFDQGSSRYDRDVESMNYSFYILRKRKTKKKMVKNVKMTRKGKCKDKIDWNKKSIIRATLPIWNDYPSSSDK